MKYRILHTTELIYEARVGLCYNLARLVPRELPTQRLEKVTLQIAPLPHDIWQGVDYFGNRTDCFSIQEPHDRLQVAVSSEVTVTPDENGLFEHVDTTSWNEVRDRLWSDRAAEIVDALQFALDSPMVAVDELLTDYARPSFPPGRPLDEAVVELMQRIHGDFKYDPEFSTIATPLKDVMEHRSGVCQDFAHLALGCLRSQGLAARYVSGYLETDPPPGKKRLVGADASHAWFSVFRPGRGWLDLDPTNNQRPGERYVTVAWGRDYADVTPLKGVAYGGGEHELKVAVDVLRIAD